LIEGIHKLIQNGTIFIHPKLNSPTKLFNLKMVAILSIVLFTILINMMAKVQCAPTTEELEKEIVKALMAPDEPATITEELAKEIAKALVAPDEPSTTTPPSTTSSQTTTPPMIAINGGMERKFEEVEKISHQYF
jgi:hypothetical protein